MVDEEGRKEDKFDEFDDTGEALGYISISQARLLAMRTAREEPGSYGSEYDGVSMFFEVVQEEEEEDYYVITLSFRPQGNFSGTPGREQCFITKEGSVDHRQVMGLPTQSDPKLPHTPKNNRNFLFLIIGGLAVIAAISVAMFFFIQGGNEDVGDSVPASVSTAQLSPASPLIMTTSVPTNPPIPPTQVPIVTEPIPTNTPVPPTQVPVAPAIPTPTMMPPTATPAPATPIRVVTVPIPTNTPIPPTQVPVAPAIPTPTMVPPTATPAPATPIRVVTVPIPTNTPVPPTQVPVGPVIPTPTMVPPTATPAPATPIRVVTVPIPTNTPIPPTQVPVAPAIPTPTMVPPTATPAPRTYPITSNTWQDLDPVWDPQGKRIAFKRSKHGTGPPYDIWLASSDGSGEVVGATGPNQIFGIANSLSWIGSTGLLLTNEMVNQHEHTVFDTEFAPFTRSISNGNDNAFTAKLTIPGGQGGESYSESATGLSVSRNGKLVMWRNKSSNYPPAVISIRIAPISELNGQRSDWHGTTLLSHNGREFDRGFSLSSDGEQFVISLKSGNGFDLFLRSAQTGDLLKQLTFSGAQEGEFNVDPDFSPDKKTVVFINSPDNIPYPETFTALPDNQPDIYTINIEGENLTRITDTPDLSEGRPSFSPSGEQITYEALNHGNMDWNIYVTYLSLGIPVPTSAPPPDQATVNFPDTNLDTAIRQALRKDIGQQITVEDLADLTLLNANNKGISDLSGIELCLNLTELHLFGNQISDITPLASLTNLSRLHLDANEISDVTPIRSLTNLEELDLFENQISDLTPLSPLTNLTRLHLYNNQISDLTPLTSLTNLKRIHLEGNQISDIIPLTLLSNLTHVYLGGNKLNQEGINIHVPDLEARGVDVNL